MKNFVFTILLLASISTSWAQRTTVKLTAVVKKPMLTYNTNTVILKFDKQHFLDAYAAVEKGTWADSYLKEKDAAQTAIDWLKAQQKPVQLQEKISDLAKPEQALAWLVKHLIGASLIMKGETEIYEFNSKQKKELIEAASESTDLMGNHYTFFYPGQTSSFLETWNVNEQTVRTDETTIDVFEAPVEERVAMELEDPNKIYTVVEIQPEYPGGMTKWTEYVNKSLRYPKDALSNQTEGSVYVGFVVSETGKLTDIMVIKGLSPSCDNEAVRIVQESIDWKPAKQNGKAVKSRFVIPVKFNLAQQKMK